MRVAMRRWAQREYDETRCGGPLRTLSTARLKITANGVRVVRKHVSRFKPDATREELMIERLEGIVVGSVPPTESDRAFYSHELREFVRFRRLGIVGAGTYDEWNNAHSAALEEYAVDGKALYHSSIPAP